MAAHSRSAKLVVHTASAAATHEWGRRLGERLAAGDFVALCGPLGAGKTCFVQGLGEGLGVVGRITSPTFIIIRHHPGAVPLCHADAYRVGGPDELEDAGLLECLGQAVVALEWAERTRGLWPDDLYLVELSLENEGRRLAISGLGADPEQIVNELRDALTGTRDIR